MARISQKTLVEMMRLASRFGIYESSFDTPLVSPTEMRRHLFARGFSKETLDEFERMFWSFDDILPAISDDTFGKRNLFGKRSSIANGKQVQPEELLLKMAMHSCTKEQKSISTRHTARWLCCRIS